MKKRLFSLVLVLALCMGLTVNASAESAPSFGADTWAAGTQYFLDGIDSRKNPDAFCQATGLILTQHQEEVYSPLSGLPFSYNRCGLKNATGNLVFPENFYRFEYIGENRIVGYQYDFTSNASGWPLTLTGVYSTSGNVLLPLAEIELRYADDTKQNFLVSKSSEVMVGETGDPDDLMTTQFLNRLYGLYDWNFNEILPMEYHSIDYMGDGYYRVRKGMKNLNAENINDKLIFDAGVYKYGTGIIISCQRNLSVSYLGSDMFRVGVSPFCYGAIDGNGKQVLPFVYAGIRDYYDGYFSVSLFRNAWSRQLALQTDSPSAKYHFMGCDLSDSGAYLTMGIVDRNGNALSSFDHEEATISQNGTVKLGMWNGELGWVWPLGNNGFFSTYKFWGKTYDYETIPATELTLTGKSVSDILQERGIATSDTTNLPTAVGGFTDVKSNDYFADAVLWAVEKNITSGTSKTAFSPNETCSKAQILTFLWRANDSPEPTAANPFTDIKTTDYFYKAALWAAEKGLLSGSTFGANTDCTRAMTVEYLWKAAGSPTPSANASFTDVPANAEYAQAVAWAVENEITSGTGGGNFSPAATCTRGQIVTFLYRAMGK